MLLLGGELWAEPALSFQGQASAWIDVNPDEELSVWLGARYTPQVNFPLLREGDRRFDCELSATIHGLGGLHPFDSTHTEGALRAYRAWARVAMPRMELRLGLQKINFGSASVLRPLMWFDQVDPRDPLQITNGVWGLLGRYYFLSNANIWLWGLYGNEGPKSWELCRTATNTPEFGGRAQVPVPRGEAALSFHHRTADLTSPGLSGVGDSHASENRWGVDAKVDVGIGLWLEGTWMSTRRDIGSYTNQHILNLGADYTFGLGNGLNAIAEQLLVSYDRDPFTFGSATHISAVSLLYPLNILDSISAILYRNWTKEDSYAFVSWRRQLDSFTFHLMAFWNPKTGPLPQRSDSADMLAKRGFQVMVVFHH
ncbi:hypothetical protein JXA88_01115 [Candidatus Fermentibacteria bacterium]|nr:hypothetical protein [Candidatus Fermentibacteria bacterium]